MTDAAVTVLGLDPDTGAPMEGTEDPAALGARWFAMMDERRAQLRRAVKLADRFRGERQAPAAVDLDDPLVGGWRWIVAADDPDRDALIAAMRPLAERRGAPEPLVLPTLPPERWSDWIEQIPKADATKRTPTYLVMVGAPARLPFELQVLLQSASRVGRLCFGGADALAVYVDKALRHETAPAPTSTASAVVFATDHGERDPTRLSRRWLAEPLAGAIAAQTGVSVRSLMGDGATRDALLEVLRQERPALVVTVGHGLVARHRDLAEQQRINGSICCQPEAGKGLADTLITADDVPAQGACMEGAVLFQVGCSGYGTPSKSMVARWLGVADDSAGEDFVSALPQRLLAHPRGPIAYVGHLDLAWQSAFKPLGAGDAPSQRAGLFVDAVTSLLRTERVGAALWGFHQRLASALLELLTWAQPPADGWTTQDAADAMDVMLRLADARQHMVLGDPALRLRIPVG